MPLDSAEVPPAARSDGRARLGAGIRAVLANAGWVSLGHMLRLAIGLVVSVWVIRYLGPRDFGLLSYALALVLLLAPFSKMGLRKIISREIIRDHEARHLVLGSSFFVQTVAGGATFLAVLAIMAVARPGDRDALLVAAVIGPLLLFDATDVIRSWFDSQLKSKFAVIARTAGFAGASAVRVGLLLMGAPLLAFAVAVLLESLLAALWLVCLYWRSRESPLRWRVSSPVTTRLLKDGWPLMFAGISVAVYMRIDQVMIGNILGDTELGVYSAAVHLVTAWYLVPTAVTTSVFPLIVAARKANSALYYHRLKAFYTFMAMAAIAVAVPTALLARPLMSVFFGEDYVEGSTTLAIYGLSLLPTFVGMATSQYLVTENRTRISLARTVVGAVTNVGLNLILIPRYGIEGAALSTLISYFVATYSTVLMPDESRHKAILLRSLALLDLPSTLRFMRNQANNLVSVASSAK